VRWDRCLPVRPADRVVDAERVGTSAERLGDRMGDVCATCVRLLLV
jgi:hypothetical protein